MPDLICAVRSHIEVVIAHAATSTFVNLVQDLLQGLHGCVPTSHSRHHLKRLPALRQVQTLLLHCLDTSDAETQGQQQLLMLEGFIVVGWLTACLQSMRIWLDNWHDVKRLTSCELWCAQHPLLALPPTVLWTSIETSGRLLHAASWHDLQAAHCDLYFS